MQVRVGAAVVLVAFLLLALGFLRPRLFGANYFIYHGVPTRSYDEQAMARLAWFFPHVAFLLALLGLAVIALRRWSAALWIIAIPLLMLLPVYGYRPRIASQLMWWVRRFVPTILPGLGHARRSVHRRAVDRCVAAGRRAGRVSGPPTGPPPVSVQASGWAGCSRPGRRGWCLRRSARQP